MKVIDAVNGVKTHSEEVVRLPAITRPLERLATGLKARRYDGSAGLGESPCNGRSVTLVIVTSWIAV